MFRRFLRRLYHKLLYRPFLRLKSPRMVWGYYNNDGTYLDKVRISDTAFLYHRQKIHFENNIFVWHYTILDGTGGLRIGEGSQIGAWVGIFTHSSHLAIRLYGQEYLQVPEEEKKAYPIEPVTIGKYVFLGAGAKVLPGVEIGDASLLAAGTVLSKSVPPYSVVAGNPGEIVGDTRKMDQKMIDQYPELEHAYVGTFPGT